MLCWGTPIPWLRAECGCGRGRGGQGEGGCRGRRSEGEREKGWRSRRTRRDVMFVDKRTARVS